MQMPVPGPQHKLLERIAGNWLGEEIIHPSPMDPVGGRAVGHVQNVLALDGFAVVQDYEQQRRGGVTFRGHGVFRYDATFGRYQMIWLDSVGMPPSSFEGTFEDGVLELSMAMPQGSVRATWDFRIDGRYSYRMDVSGDGVEWTPFMEGTYLRQY